MGEDFDSGLLNGDDPGGRCRVTGVGDETRFVGGANQTEDEDAEDVKQEDTDPDTTNGLRDVLGRVVGFSGSHSENLGSQEGVGSADQNGPDTGKTTQRARDVMVLDECAGIVLRKTNSVILLVLRRDCVKHTQ